jgi:hypothetical protein
MSCDPKITGPPPLGMTDMTLMCISLNDVKRRAEPFLRPIGRSNTRTMCLMIKSYLEAATSPCAQWWVEEDLNLRPHAYQACALTT